MNRKKPSRGLLRELWRRLVFWAGDTRSSDAFPWFTWAKNEPLTGLEAIQEALPLIRYGDVGLHRLNGYLSNAFIRGFMIHAWVHTDDGIPGKIVEALSEGVVYQSPIYPMLADYTIIVRPLGVTDKERRGACLKAKQIVGREYDDLFEFDMEHELQHCHEPDHEKSRQHLIACRKQFRNYNPAFSCTEVAAYAWLHKAQHLRIERTKDLTGEAVKADTFLNPAWKIVWMSNSVTPGSAKAFGLSGPGLQMIREYRKKHRVRLFDPQECPLPAKDRRNAAKSSLALRR